MIILNKKARFNYLILETFEAGIALTGSEVKSIREGKISLDGSHVQFGIGSPPFTIRRLPFTTIEAYLIGLHTSSYLPAGRFATDPARPKKLLLHRNEILNISVKARAQNSTVIPLRLYDKHGKIKVEIAIAKGKKKWEKREIQRRRSIDREIRQRF
jgi:SsrA-binding protein